jgi:septum formation protein
MIILASQSPARAALLRRAGIAFETRNPDFDEDEAKEQFTATDAKTLALFLARGKAASVSRLFTAACVIGADQTLRCQNTLYDKPGNMQAARAQLLSLRGKTHVLTSAVCCYRSGLCTWSHCEEAFITFRDFSDAALDTYLHEAGDGITSSVGAYHYEGAGVRLMANVRGSDHVILGLPLLPLLAYLRSEGLAPQ